jgi:hypothetical protein
VDYDLLVIGATITACVLGLPIVRATVRRLEGRGAGMARGGDDMLRGEIDELRARMEAMDEVDHRLTEVEERLDFTERVLTQKKHEELPKGH